MPRLLFTSRLGSRLASRLAPRLAALLLCAALGSSLCLACGSSSTTGTGPLDGGPTATSGGTVAPSGTCHFTLRDGSASATYDGTVRARMNGSGNLLVECDTGDAGLGALTLHFGNATFNGPRTYHADDFTSDGLAEWAPDGNQGAHYSSDRKGAACTLLLTQASPLDVRGDSVQTGGQVIATFGCTAMLATSTTADPASIMVEDGALSAVVE